MAVKDRTKQPQDIHEKPEKQGKQGKKIDATIQLNFNDMMKFLANLLKSGMEFRQTVEKMIDRKMDEMVVQGKYTRVEAAAAAEKLKSGLNDSICKFSGRLSDGIRATLNRMNIATLDDIQSLEARLDKMLEALGDLKSPDAPVKTPASAKPPVSAKSAKSKAKGRGKPESKTPSAGTKGRKAASKRPATSGDTVKTQA